MNLNELLESAQGVTKEKLVVLALAMLVGLALLTSLFYNFIQSNKAESQPKSIDEFRLIELEKGKKFLSGATLERDALQAKLNRANLLIRKASICIDANSSTGTAVVCKIY